jgi:hypothetical protein
LPFKCNLQRYSELVPSSLILAGVLVLYYGAVAFNGGALHVESS